MVGKKRNMANLINPSNINVGLVGELKKKQHSEANNKPKQ